MKIFKILNEAAEKYLWDGRGNVPTISTKKALFSCWAISLANEDLKQSHEIPTKTYICNMGVDIFSMTEFDEFRKGKERQAARFLWLKFAALVAEEEGL